MLVYIFFSHLSRLHFHIRKYTTELHSQPCHQMPVSMRVNYISSMYFKYKKLKLLIQNTNFTEVDCNLPAVFSRFLKTCSPIYTRSECICCMSNREFGDGPLLSTTV